MYEISKFVVNEDNKQHLAHNSFQVINAEIEEIYHEELNFSGLSYIYIAESNGQLIGCIRVMKWNKKDILFIRKLFQINPLNSFGDPVYSNYWHIGRFAISSSLGLSSVSLLKQLIIFAIHPIYHDENSYMLAECDRRLLRTVHSLGMDVVQLDKGIQYLGSETIPMYISKKGLTNFYNRCGYLLESRIESINYQFA